MRKHAQKIDKCSEQQRKMEQQVAADGNSTTLGAKRNNEGFNTPNSGLNLPSFGKERGLMCLKYVFAFNIIFYNHQSLVRNVPKIAFA